MKLRVELKSNVLKRLEKLRNRQPKDYGIILNVLERFAETGRGDLRPVGPSIFRLRAGNWRLFLFWEGDYVEVLRIFHRSEEPYEPYVIRALVRDVKMLKEAVRRAKVATGNTEE